jgi:hypothetical protein
MSQDCDKMRICGKNRLAERMAAFGPVTSHSRKRNAQHANSLTLTKQNPN